MHSSHGVGVAFNWWVVNLIRRWNERLHVSQLTGPTKEIDEVSKSIFQNKEI